MLLFQRADMDQGKRDSRMSLRTSARTLHALVAGFILTLVLAVSLSEHGAWAQSGVIAGSTLDPYSPSDSLLPSGSFRLDGPSDAPVVDPNALWHAGATSLGLQIYGSYNVPSHESEAPAATAPSDSEPTRP